AVIAAFKFHQLRAASETARETNGRHRCFGAAAYQAHHLDRWDRVDDFLRELHFEFRRCAKPRAAGCAFLYRGDDFLVRLTEDHRPPRTDVIDVSVSVDVGDGGAACRADEAWCTADT